MRVCARTRACVWVCVRSHATTDNDASYISAVGYLLVATVCLGECSVCVKFVQCWVSVKFVCCWPPAPVFNPKNPNKKNFARTRADAGCGSCGLLINIVLRATGEPGWDQCGLRGGRVVKKPDPHITIGHYF